jgi:hypothetical protein
MPSPILGYGNSPLAPVGSIARVEEAWAAKVDAAERAAKNATDSEP